MKLRKSHDFNPEKFLAADAKKKAAAAFPGLESRPAISFSRSRNRIVLNRIKSKFAGEKEDADAERQIWKLSGIARDEVEAELKTLGIAADAMLINLLLISIIHEPTWQKLVRRIIE